MELITIYGQKDGKGMIYYKDRELKNIFAFNPWHYHKKDQII